MIAMKPGVSAGNHVHDNECIIGCVVPVYLDYLRMISELENATPPSLRERYGKRESSGTW